MDVRHANGTVGRTDATGCACVRTGGGTDDVDGCAIIPHAICSLGAYVHIAAKCFHVRAIEPHDFVCKRREANTSNAFVLCVSVRHENVQNGNYNLSVARAGAFSI